MISGYAIATLVVFIVSIFFVICPVSIPTPRPLPRIPINLTTAPILAIALLWAAQCLDPAVIRNGIVGTDGVKPYNILILFFSLAYMAITLDTTGILKAAAYWVSNKGGTSAWRLYFYFYVMLTLVSILLGNDPVILSGTAFLVYFTKHANDIGPIPWIMAEFAAANTASMVLFVGNPTNVVICEGFSVNNAAFTAYTILPFIACNVMCFIALAAQYRNHVNPELSKSNHDVRDALTDPVGAVVGSLMLGSTLVLCLVVSFFGIDVWMITLPFAVAKFVFDIAWDYYRYSRNIGVPEHTTEKSLNQSPPTDLEQSQASIPSDETAVAPSAKPSPSHREPLHDWLKEHSAIIKAFPRLPFGLIPFAFSQFILIEALNHQGWVNVFAVWLVKASGKQMYPTIWLIGVLGVILCNLAGTNIGATILLTKVVRAAALPYPTDRAAAIALAVASNIGAVSFTFSASLAGLLWKSILGSGTRPVEITQWEFASRNMFPLLVMTVVGLGVVSAEMAVLFPSS